MSSDITRHDIADMLGLTANQVYYRERILGIQGQEYTDYNIRLIENQCKTANKKKEFRSAIKIEIINLHIFGHSKNKIKELTRLHWRQIKNTIEEWIDNENCIFVDSKINHSV